MTVLAVLLSVLLAGPAGSTSNKVPDFTIIFPTSTTVDLDDWDPGCGTAVGDICGTAKDNSGHGLGKVQVAIKRAIDGKWWNGTSFTTSSSALFLSLTPLSKWSVKIQGAYLSPGVYAVTLKISDKKDQVRTVTFNVTLVRGSPPPAPTINSGPLDPTNTRSASFIFSSVAGVTNLCRLDGGSWATCSTNVSFAGPLSEATHTFAVKARDTSGRESAETKYSWKVDITNPPVPVIGSAPALSTRSTSASFSFSDAEAGVTLLCQYNGSAWATCTSPKTFNGLGVMAHTFSVKARDLAGNESAAATRTWTVEASPRGRILALRESLASRRSSLHTNHARFWLDRTLESLDWAATSSLWTSSGLVTPTAAGENGLRALCSAIRRMYWSDSGLRAIAGNERLTAAQILQSILLDRIAAVPSTAPGLATARYWQAKGDASLASRDLYKAGSYYLRAWSALR